MPQFTARAGNRIGLTACRDFSRKQFHRNMCGRTLSHPKYTNFVSEKKGCIMT